MQSKSAVSIPFDVSALPEGFRRTVEREFAPNRYRESHDALLWALSAAWGQSTAKQRISADDGVNHVLRLLVADQDPAWKSYAAGVIGGSCLDLSMQFVDLSQLDGATVLRGVQDAGGVRVNGAIADLIDDTLTQVPSGAVMVDRQDPLAVNVCTRTIPLPEERRDLEDGIRQAFRARPQLGAWRVSVVGENGGHSDRHAFTFARAGVDQGTLVCSVSDLHMGRGGPGTAREKLIAEVRASVDLWLRERGTPAPSRSSKVRPSSNVVEFVAGHERARGRAEGITYMVDRWLTNCGWTMANVTLDFVQGSRFREVSVVEATGRRALEQMPENIPRGLVESILKRERGLAIGLGFVRICVEHYSEPMPVYAYCAACLSEDPPRLPGRKPARDYWEITQEEWDACLERSTSESKRLQLLKQHPLQSGEESTA